MRSLAMKLGAALITAIGLLPSTARADDGATVTLSTDPMPPARSDAEAEKDRVLFAPGIHHGGYGGPEVKVTSFTGDAAMLLGGQAGWIINRSFVLGVAGYGLPTAHSPDQALMRPEGPSRIGFGYGGARIAYVIAPRDIVHFSFGVLVGAGGVTVVTNERGSDRNHSHDGGAVFALEPQAEFEINVHRHVRMALGGSYRYISGTNSPGLAASDLSGPAGGLAFKFGRF